MLWVQGYYDDEYYSDDTIWPALRNAPKRYITGPFPHVAPDSVVPDWPRVLARWFDYWLKGIGPRPEHLGQVSWEEARDPGVPPAVFPTGPWHHTRAWPPPEAHREVLHLAGDALQPKAALTSRVYQSLPTPEGTNGPLLGPGGYYGPKPFVCQTSGPTRLLYATAPLKQPVTIAGNPFALLQLNVDQPGGIVTVNLLDVTGDPVRAPPRSATAPRICASANGNWRAQPPPLGLRFAQRVDLTAIGHVVPAGHRVALLLSHGPPLDHTSKYLPSVTVSGRSELVVPLTDGTLGGSPPRHRYPPRPFAGPRVGAVS